MGPPTSSHALPGAGVLLTRPQRGHLMCLPSAQAGTSSLIPHEGQVNSVWPRKGSVAGGSVPPAPP